jgi:hypothetical protein
MYKNMRNMAYQISGYFGTWDREYMIIDERIGAVT